MPRRMSLLPLLALCSILPPGLDAGAEGRPEKDWEARITPYAWLTRIDGNIDARGQSQNFSASIEDVLSHFGGGAFLNGSFRWRRFLVLGDLVFARLTDDLTADSVQVGPPLLGIEVGPLKTDVTFYEVTAALNFGYRLLDRPFPGRDAGAANDPRRLVVDAWAGARYWYFHQHFKLSIPPATIGGTPVPGGGRTRYLSGSDWWVDPMLGVTVEARPWESWSFAIGGGVGGFGIGSASKFAWTGVVEGSWHFSEHWSAVLAYKGLGFNRDFGGDDLDIAMHGPVLGVSYRF
jgi:hypothetical protein